MEDGNNGRLGTVESDGLNNTQGVVEEQTRVQSVTYWSECAFPSCDTNCPGTHCEEHGPGSGSSSSGVGLNGIQTGGDINMIDDLVDGETEMTSVLHRVDDLRIVRLDDAIGTEYRIEEREDGSWETRSELSREELLLVSGMVNKQWGGE